MEERGGDRLLVEAQSGADRGDADRVGDERLARAALLALVGSGGEPEGARDELDIDVPPLRGELGEQRFQELLVPLACRNRCHCLSVLAGFRA